jgi:hypothetical protein
VTVIPDGAGVEGGRAEGGHGSCCCQGAENGESLTPCRGGSGDSYR